MKLQEIMERTNIPQVGLAKALIKDAIHLIKSSYPEEIRVDKQNIIDGESEYILPYNMIQLKSISIKDTNGSYKEVYSILNPSVISSSGYIN